LQVEHRSCALDKRSYNAPRDPEPMTRSAGSGSHDDSGITFQLPPGHSLIN
jgi:hypothetical protein